MSTIKKLIISSIIVMVAFFTIMVKANSSSSNDVTNNISYSSTTLLDSNLFTHVDDLSPYTQDEFDMTNFTKTLENDHLILYVDDESLAIRVKNKNTGFIWASDINNLDEAGLSRTWKKTARSAFTLSFYDDRNRTLDKTMLDSDLALEKVIDSTNNQVTFHVDLLDYEIRLSFTIILSESELEFSLNRESIEEYGDNRLKTISFYEFLGAAKMDNIPGYNFIPSGNGALLRYGANSQINNQFRARFYGQDLYYTTSEGSIKLNYPVYGAVHGINQNGFLFNITSGAEFAVYNYQPPGYRTDYHIQYTTFRLRENYTQPISGTDNIMIIEKNLKNYDIKFNISFLTNDDANYVGMAKEYKAHLLKTGSLTEGNVSENLELHLEVFGSDYESGIFFNKTQKMTKVSDILNINEELESQGVNNIFYTLRGFNKGGYTDASFDNYEFYKTLGDYKDLRELDVSYYYNPMVSYQTKEKAPRDSLELITKTYGQRIILDGDYYEYYTDIKTIDNEFERASKKIDAYGGMALDGLSNNFYSNKNLYRNEMYDIYEGLLDKKIPMYNPNSIMLSETSKFLNVPFQHERLRFYTDNVPFLQIVLSGYVPYYSTYLNFSANLTIDILKVIDFGANPAFLITKEPSHLLTNTLAREFYASYYGNLDGYIVDSYKYINEALKDVIGQEIVSRQVIAEGIVVTKYENDVEIIVNYSDNDFETKDYTVEAKDYYVRKLVS